MNYVKGHDINGVFTKQVACIELHGKPNAATEGAVGVLGIDVDSPIHDVYKCVAVNGSIYTWELLSSGLSIMSASISGAGAKSVEFPYAELKTPQQYVVKVGDLILDKEGYLYQINALGASSCGATYCGTQVVAYGMSAYDFAIKYGFEGSEEEWLLSLKGESGVYIGSGEMPDWANVQIDPGSEDVDYVVVQETGDSMASVMSQKSVGVLCNNILKDAIDLIRLGEVTYSLSFTNHAINHNTGEQSAASDIRASTPHLYYVPKGCEFRVVYNSGYNGSLYAFNASGDFLGADIHSDEVAYVRILTVKRDNTLAITPEEAIENTSLTIICKDTFQFLEQEINKTKGYFMNDNLLCAAEYRKGAYWNGAFSNSSSYNVFYTIPVKSGVKYIIKPKARFVITKAMPDGSGAVIDSLTSGNHTEYIPSGDGYMYLTMYSSNSEDGYAFYEEGKTAIAPYNKVFLSDKVEIQNATNGQASTDILYGKKWAPLGDSFTHGSRSAYFTEGRYAGKQKTYPYFIGNRADMEILSQFFSGGRTLAYPSDGTFTNSVTCPTAACYYQNIPEDTDYVTIYLGINDSHHESGTSGSDGEDVTGVIPLGTIDDSDTSTYYGAWNVVLTWLRENRPFTHVGMLVSNGCDRTAYRTAQLEIAKKHGVPFIDLNGDERTPVMIRSMNTDIASSVRNTVTRKQAVDYDGSITGSVNTHPNDDAHEFESHFIENFLRSL